MPPKSCCGGLGKTTAPRARRTNRNGVGPRAGGGAVGAAKKSATRGDDDQLSPTEHVLADLCLQSTVLHLDGLRTRYGFVLGASLRTPRSTDVTQQEPTTGGGGGVTADPYVVFSDLYTLQEAADLCDDPDNHVVGVAVDVAGLAPGAPESADSERVRCWFVLQQATTFDYVIASDGTGGGAADLDSVRWARLRRSELGQTLDPSDPRAGFLEPSCMTQTCRFTQRELPAACQQNARKYCRRPEKVHTPYCSDFFASTDGDADDILDEHCMRAVREADGKLSRMDARDRHLCPCHYPSSVYHEYFKHLRGASNAQAPCAFSDCAASRFKPRGVKNGTVRCPNVQVCVQNCNIYNRGSIAYLECNQRCEIRAAEYTANGTDFPASEGGDGSGTNVLGGRQWHSVAGAGARPKKSSDDGDSSHPSNNYRRIGIVVAALVGASLLAYAIRCRMMKSTAAQSATSGTPRSPRKPSAP